MGNILSLLITLIFIFLFKITKQDYCQSDELTISVLGKCEKIFDFLENENLTLKTENLFYLASNNEGKISKAGLILEIYKLNDTRLQSHNMRKSKLYIPKTCMEEMEKHSEIQLNKNKGVVILVTDTTNVNRNNIPDNYFIIRHNSISTNKAYINSKNFNFNFCNKDPILYENEININNLTYMNYTDEKPLDIDTILYGRKFGIDLFDPNNEFFNDMNSLMIYVLNSPVKKAPMLLWIQESKIIIKISHFVMIKKIHIIFHIIIPRRQIISHTDALMAFIKMKKINIRI